MKPSRAAALALVGWYLILPLPVRAAGGACDHVRSGQLKSDLSPSRLATDAARSSEPGPMLLTSTTASLISFGCIFGGSLAGIDLRSALPARYSPDEEKDVLRLGRGLITTLSALVAGPAAPVSTAKKLVRCQAQPSDTASHKRDSGRPLRRSSCMAQRNQERLHATPSVIRSRL